MVKSPCGSLVVVRGPWRTSEVAVMVAPPTGRFCASVTVPRMVPVWTPCARAVAPQVSSAARQRITHRIGRLLLVGYWHTFADERSQTAAVTLSLFCNRRNLRTLHDLSNTDARGHPASRHGHAGDLHIALIEQV